MTSTARVAAVPLEVGRYLLYDVIASGGMASVFLGRIVGPAGFSRVLAIKRLHPHLARDPKFAAMFLDEARLASRITHPNVVPTVDVVAQDGELFLVMEYVRGESLAQLLGMGGGPELGASVSVLVSIAAGALYGLHAAHEARDPTGRALDIVHRDVSPQNILVGIDGVARVVDFGIAKAVSRHTSTMDGELKGKLGYMAPEQLRRGQVDRRTDIYAAAVVLWEALTGRRLFTADAAGGIVLAVLEGNAPPPSAYRAGVDPALDLVVLRGLARDPNDRYQTAMAMADALSEVAPLAPPREIGEWVERAARAALAERALRVAEVERGRLEPRGDAMSSDAVGVLSGDERHRLASAATGPIDIAPPAPPGEATTVDDGPPMPDEHRRHRGLSILALFGVVAISAFAAAGLRHCEPTAATAPLAAESSTSIPREGPPTATAPLPSAASSASLVAETADTSNAPAPDASLASPAPPPKANAIRKTPSRRAAPVPRTPVAEPIPAGCDPPYTLDENGIKRFKRWCKNTE